MMMMLILSFIFFYRFLVQNNGRLSGVKIFLYFRPQKRKNGIFLSLPESKIG